MYSAFFAPALALGSILGILAMLEWGRYLGKRALAADGEAARVGVTVIEGAVYALTGLLIAFTFSGAAQRFDQRRALVVQETNDVGTAWLRVDTLPPETQEPVRVLFRAYLDSRIATYRAVPDFAAVKVEQARTNVLQGQLWAKAVASCRMVESTAPCVLLLPALNAMFDTSTTRTAAVMMHPPWVIYGILWLFVLVSAVLAGHAMAGMRHRGLLHTVVYAAIMGAILYVIGDIEMPRIGLIRVDAFDSMLVSLREGMG